LAGNNPFDAHDISYDYQHDVVIRSKQACEKTWLKVRQVWCLLHHTGNFANLFLQFRMTHITFALVAIYWGSGFVYDQQSRGFRCSICL